MNRLRNLVPVRWWTRACRGGQTCWDAQGGWHTHHLTAWGAFALGVPLR